MSKGAIGLFVVIALVGGGAAAWFANCSSCSSTPAAGPAASTSITSTTPAGGPSAAVNVPAGAIAAPAVAKSECGACPSHATNAAACAEKTECKDAAGVPAAVAGTKECAEKKSCCPSDAGKPAGAPAAETPKP